MLFTILAGRTAAPIRSAKRGKQIARMKKSDEQVLDDFIKAYGTVLRTPEGRQVVWELMTECGLYVDDGDVEGERVHYNRGRRSIGLRVLATLNGTFQNEFVLMQREAWARIGFTEAVIAEAVEGDGGDE